MPPGGEGFLPGPGESVIPPLPRASDGSPAAGRCVAAAVSGGVDSLCALLLLRRAGCDVLALHGLFTPDARGDSPAVGRLREACASLGVPLHVLDARDAFRRAVMEPFAAAWAAGLTPNPCAACNRGIKFGILWDAARRLGADSLATGHYVRLVVAEEDGEPLPAAAADAGRDQGYFLALVPRDRLRNVILPLADLGKTAVRALVADAGLEVPIPAESREICFIPPEEDAYRDFLVRRWREAGIRPPDGGDIVLEEDGRILGRHGGLWRHTPGQRRGLGVAWSEPLYVLEKDIARNRLLVGPKSRLGMASCTAGEANILLDPAFWPERTLVRTRYRQTPLPARTRLEDGRLRIVFDAPSPPSAHGQIAVIHDSRGRILAGGVVEDMERVGA